MKQKAAEEYIHIEIGQGKVLPARGEEGKVNYSHLVSMQTKIWSYLSQRKSLTANDIRQTTAYLHMLSLLLVYIHYPSKV